MLIRLWTITSHGRRQSGSWALLLYRQWWLCGVKDYDVLVLRVVAFKIAI